MTKDEDSSSRFAVAKFLCSYGGRIMPRRTDGKLRYVGGHTRVLSVDRSISFAELMVKLGELCGSSVQLRCQLPDGDLETLVSITSDEDLRHLMTEYDKASSDMHTPMKIRAVLSPPKSLKSISPPISPLGNGHYCSPPASSRAKDARFCLRPFLQPNGNRHICNQSFVPHH